MCTLSFLPEADGYVVGMNRDELKSRSVANGPEIHKTGEVHAIYPHETAGGTWIAANSRGNLLALLNWNLANIGQLPEKLRSRGVIIPSLMKEEAAEGTERALKTCQLVGVHPFRLIGIFASEQDIREWRWDGQNLRSRWHEWARNHWFSSSRSDVRAEATRNKACEMMWQGAGEPPVCWLRKLHSSHLPEAGAYSICVHREDASTVSFTEVQYCMDKLAMTYVAGNPCTPKGEPMTVRISTMPVSRVAGAKLAV